MALKCGEGLFGKGVVVRDCRQRGRPWGPLESTRMVGGGSDEDGAVRILSHGLLDGGDVGHGKWEIRTFTVVRTTGQSVIVSALTAAKHHPLGSLRAVSSANNRWWAPARAIMSVQCDVSTHALIAVMARVPSSSVRDTAVVPNVMAWPTATVVAIKSSKRIDSAKNVVFHNIKV